MPRLTRIIVLSLSLTVALTGGRHTAAAAAEAAGQEDLDQATKAKLTADTLADLEEVIRLCESAIEKGLEEADLPFANSLLASSLIQRGTARTKLLARVPHTDPKWPELRKAALADFEKAVRVSPEQAGAFFFIAQLNVLPDGDQKRAAEALDRAIELPAPQPDVKVKALTLRASIEKDPEKKMADLNEAIRLVPHNAPALRSRGLLRAQQDNLEAALEDLDKALEVDPKHVATYELKAAALAQLKRYDEAMVCLDQIHELLPKSIQPVLQKVRLHIAQENLDAALHELNRAATSDPKNLEVLLLRGSLYQRMGESEKALADADRMLVLKPDLPAAMRFRAAILAETDRVDEAVAQLKTIHEKNPEDLLTLLQLGVLYAADKQYDQAVASYSKVIDKRPDHWVALRARGDTLLNTGKHGESIADFQRALKLQPKDSGILNNLAWVLATSPLDEVRDGPRAIELATEACEVTKYEQAHILSTLAAAYAETGDFEAAIKWSQKAVEISGEEHLEALKKELESYQARKPWREILPAP